MTCTCNIKSTAYSARANIITYHCETHDKTWTVMPVPQTCCGECLKVRWEQSDEDFATYNRETRIK